MVSAKCIVYTANIPQVMSDGKSEEHALEYQELFNEYLLIFEGKLEEFIGKSTSVHISVCPTAKIGCGSGVQ